MKQCAENRRMAAAAQVDRRNTALDERRIDRFGAHAEVLVDLRPPAHRAHGRIRVRQGVVAARGIEQVQIEIRREVLPEAHALIVELHPFRSEVVRANDGGVAAGIAAAEVALVEYRHIANAVIARQVIGGCQTMAARADDDHVIRGTQRVMTREHSRFRMLARQAETK